MAPQNDSAAASGSKRSGAAETKNSPKKKRQCKNGKPKDDRSFEYNGAHKEQFQKVSSQVFGCVDITLVLFGFLDVRELYNLCFSSKANMQQLKHEHVVRAAMYHGGRIKTNMERIVNLVASRSIWIPSPQRMLRLVNGKRCENCNTNGCTSVNEFYGLFFCSKRCLNRNTGEISHQKWSPYHDHGRVARHPKWARYSIMWCTDFKSRGIGPLVSKDQLRELIGQHQDDDSDETRLQRLEALLSEMDASDPHAGDAQCIVDAFRDCLLGANQRIQEKREDQMKSVDKAIEARKAKTSAMIAQLKGLVPDDVKWKPFLDDYYLQKPTSARLKAQFKYALINDHMHPITSAPSKATKKKLKAVVTDITNDFAFILSSGFADLSFLNEWVSGDDAVKSAWAKGIRAFYSSGQNGIGTRSFLLPKIGRDALGFIREGKYLDALGALINNNDNTNEPVWFHATSMLHDAARRGLESTMSPFVEKFVEGSERRMIEHNIEQLVYSLWRLRFQEESDEPVGLEERFHLCYSAIPELYQCCDDFLNDPETVEWKNYVESQNEEGIYYDRFDRRVRLWSMHSREYVGFLAGREFEAVRKYLAARVRIQLPPAQDKLLQESTAKPEEVVSGEEHAE